MPQDDAREKRLIDRFNLERPANRVRHGTDAILNIDGRTLEFELKSVSTGKGITTVRDFGRNHIAKWKNKHWLIAFCQGDEMLYFKYGSPAAMAPWIEEKWRYIKADLELASHLPSRLALKDMFAIVGKKKAYTKNDAKDVHKKQYSAREYREQMDIFKAGRGGKMKPVGFSPNRMLEILRDRAKYVIERGSTLNNPSILPKYFANWEKITGEPAARLKELVREWLAANQPQANVTLQAQPDTP